MNYITICGFVGVWLLLWIVISISQIRADITRININVNKIAEQVGVPDTITDELKSLLLEGKKVEAIKKYRIATGVGLIEAKEYIDSLQK
ncbi:50S ribosomal protein L7/L12 [Clostridium sp. OS1-26]|uniref:50S ribosomal protein L7/L12 n=1 Tax=Clostridium sp. OS1-26 TaxID=3070681 RepID=UPI0027E0B1A4|nr:50S ribosomal protein L7/L12 [Clostridium sp. OS1-26]WML32606.1 50S ribosomal protein L7/L12 [Clostridium sp. OS1-26]